MHPHREVTGEGDAVAREGDVALPVASDVRQHSGGGEVDVVEGFASVNQHLPLGNHVLPSQNLQQRRLPRTVRPQQKAAASGLELEVHVFNQRLGALDGRPIDAGVRPEILVATFVE